MARERKFSQDELFSATKEFLLIHGYEGFTFLLLAERLHISRGALYKYYDNKDELITSYMIHELKQLLNRLQEVKQYVRFDDQFDFLMELIFTMPEVQQLIIIANQISANTNEKVKNNKEELTQLHMSMYQYLSDFVRLGRQEKKLKENIPDGLILGFIFQTIAIPNHYGVPHTEWVASIKEIISHGMFTNK
ncbi:AcrR family transcriptional regulator [Cytobacillus eiseniae]|uniref:AcrR family transcriptional regulator n=1 Tax=Cytobacillus eiseniae TaxID=762947 RepID=A0ABS4RBV5_9BACI|nr:TetR/AcrR family transcriptional regulator [Cytobacillus eiseniae]MBP2240382.1 AcrR family transcriptional regulator [Cytobacillus eiseniae]